MFSFHVNFLYYVPFYGFYYLFVALMKLYCTFVAFMKIGPFQSAKGERAKVKVKVRLNVHGIVSIESATVSMEAVQYEILLSCTKLSLSQPFLCVYFSCWKRKKLRFLYQL